MIDVLVALVVLSIGLLGLAGLQATGLRYNHGAYLRTQATLLAYDMADRMRANQTGVNAGDYDSIGFTTSLAKDCSLSTVTCTPAEIAQYDAYEWSQDSRNLLPKGTGTVTKTGSLYTITVSWDDAGSGTMSFATTFQP